jgi:hypothetical protein
MVAPSPLEAIPTGRAERWTLLREVIAQWYPPLQAHDGISETQLKCAESRLGITLPTALREWYSLAGARKDIWSRQDHLLHPDEFRKNGEVLVFMMEHQNVVEWGIRSVDLTVEDPPVYVSSVDNPKVWLKENDTVSEFALQMFAYCLKWSNKCRWWANAYVGRNLVECVASRYPRLPFPEWHWPARTRFYGLRDIIAEVEARPAHDGAWLYVVTRTAAAAQSFKNLLGPLGIEWNSWSEEWPPGWVSAAEDLGDI